MFLSILMGRRSYISSSCIKRLEKPLIATFLKTCADIKKTSVDNRIHRGSFHYADFVFYFQYIFHIMVMKIALASLNDLHSSLESSCDWPILEDQ